MVGGDANTSADNSSEAMRITSSRNVGIGTTSPSKKLDVNGDLRFGSSASRNDLADFGTTDLYLINQNSSGTIQFYVGGGSSDKERMRIDSSGNVLVGKTSQDSGATIGTEILSGRIFLRRSGGAPIIADRDTNDGEVAVFKRGGSTVGSIDAEGTSYLKFTKASGMSMKMGGDALIPSVSTSYDLGSSSAVWRNIYTSDFHMSNEGLDKGNDIDGTKGSWTFQEGEENLYLINNKNGKKYKFNLTEIE